MRQITILVVSAWLLTPTIAWVQSPAASRYRVLSTNKISTLQAELAQAANEGYRVAASAGPAVVLERSNDKYEYLISGALPQDVRDQKVPPGYRILPQTVGQIANGPCGAIFERSPGDSGRREYRFEDAVYPGNLQKDILNAAVEGYRVLVIGAVAGFCAVLEREPGAAGTSAPVAGVKEAGKEKNANLGVADYSRPYVLMGTTKTSTLEKEMAEAVARGYRLQSGAAADELV